VIKVDLHTRTLDAVRDELAMFETRFGVPSDRLVDAFRVNGKLVETKDLHEWSSLYAFWQAGNRASKRGRR